MHQSMWSPVEDTGDFGPEGRPQSRNSDRETSPTVVYNPYFTGRPKTPTGSARTEVVDRQQIIRKIKEKGIARQRSREAQLALQREFEGRRSPDNQRSPTASNLLPSPQIERSTRPLEHYAEDWKSSGLEISRPRSALHRGDFSGDAQSEWNNEVKDANNPGPEHQSPALIATSPPAPWHEGFPNTSVYRNRFAQSQTPISSFAEIARPRAVSQASLSKSFSYQAPTSPLVNQSNVEDIPDPHDVPLQNPDFASDRFSRRRTFSPRSLQSFAQMLDASYGSNWSSSPPSLRKESTVPYKAHQPRRSITSFNSMPQTPMPGSRRSSTFGSSPLQSAMVGSFEESILRGRMSSTPSKPLDFTAHIGVLGMGNCKPSLKCPPHVTIPFPAVYYNYGTSHNSSDSQPSPYVGLVDLENAPPPATNSGRRRRPDVAVRSNGPSRATSPNAPDSISIEAGEQRRRKWKQKRRSRSPLQEPKGAYRIPAKGQLQIIIKNPHKTAVKLFLVPYDVSDIQPGQKTFIRQRSYSAGPILDMPVDSRRNLGTDRPKASLPATSDPQDRPVLRYLIHLHICCTSKGRIWLYKSVRVVFANRVPDGKEKLRNEVQSPEPKYSIYKSGHTSATATPLMEAHTSDSTHMDVDGLDRTAVLSPPAMIHNGRQEARSLPATNIYDNLFAHRFTEPSFRLPMLETVASRPASRGLPDEPDSSMPIGGAIGPTEPLQRVKSPKSPLSPLSPFQRAISPVTDSSEGTGSITFSRTSSTEKLATVGSESLLSRRLRDLGMSRVSSPVGGQSQGMPNGK